MSLKDFILLKTEKRESLLTSEEEEYIDSLNRLEILEREINNVQEQKEQVNAEISSIASDVQTMENLYAKRDKFLDEIFGGAYGSGEENKLEKELELLLERKKHVDQAFFKWKQAQRFAKQGCQQLGSAVKNWKQLDEIPESDSEKRYCSAAETRNYLVSASQNLQSAHRTLPNISFPYCSEEEIDTLDKAVVFIFTDMQTKERHEHAYECYRTTFKRSGALKQWFEQVMNTTISKDLAETTEESNLKAQELRQERIRLIRSKAKEITGKDTDMDIDNGSSDISDEEADEQVAQLFENERLAGKPGYRLTPESRMHSVPTPVPISDLAPMPSNEEIFGKIDELRKQHAADIADFEKAQTVNKERTNQGLQEKLQARRHRRSRMQAHEREVEEVMSRSET